MKLIDISRDIVSAEVYPGDPETKIEKVMSLDADDMYNLSTISATLHAGTHLDAPLHFIQDGLSISDIPLDKFTGDVTVLSLPDGPITGEMVENLFPRNVKKLILRTGKNSVFFGGAAEDVAAIGYELLGYDKPALGGGNEAACHRALLSSGATLLENLDLSNVAHDGEYFLIALPIKAEGLEASFTRAVLLEQEKGYA